MDFKTVKACVVFSILALTLHSCSPALYKPVPEHVSGSANYEQLVEGRKLYVSKCGSCHSLHLPHQYSADVWIKNIDEMQERAKISESEKKLIADYLDFGITQKKK